MLMFLITMYVYLHQRTSTRAATHRLEFINLFYLIPSVVIVSDSHLSEVMVCLKYMFLSFYRNFCGYDDHQCYISTKVHLSIYKSFRNGKAYLNGACSIYIVCNYKI